MSEQRSQQFRIALFYVIFVIIFVIGVALSITAPGWSTNDTVSIVNVQPTRTAEGGLHDSEVQIISKTEQWNAALATGHCVLFVDCGWNMTMVSFRPTFSEFASLSNDTYKAISVKLDANDEDEMWHTIQSLWQEHSISRGSMKNYGGAGRVVWFTDGRVVDYAWCIEVFDLDKLKLRTEKAFR